VLPWRTIEPGFRHGVRSYLFANQAKGIFRPAGMSGGALSIKNLDPRSVFSDLVPFFRTAAKRRQIIMVTHNANLVVNTDSDQVVVAEAERSSPLTLPLFSYFSGGLEDPSVRRDVCRLLEGGGDAFRKRAQRYGMVGDRLQTLNRGEVT
jgi:hypothetical protein